MSDACRRRFDAILVWKIDRFGRSLKHLVNALAELAALGVAFFISLTEAFAIHNNVVYHVFQ
jgi:DNA invertase Pin-like site-specific DNA recombinase